MKITGRANGETITVEADNAGLALDLFINLKRSLENLPPPAPTDAVAQPRQLGFWVPEDEEEEE